MNYEIASDFVIPNHFSDEGSVAVIKAMSHGYRSLARKRVRDDKKGCFVIQGNMQIRGISPADAGRISIYSQISIMLCRN